MAPASNTTSGQEDVHPSRRLERATYAFNKVLADFILRVKKQSPAVKELLRKHYRVISSASDVEAERMSASLTEEIKAAVIETSPSGVLAAISTFEVLRGCDVAALVTHVPPGYAPELRDFVYALVLLTLVRRELVSVPDEHEGVDELLEKVLAAVAAIQAGRAEADALTEEILDDEYRAILSHMTRNRTADSGLGDSGVSGVSGVSGNKEDVNDEVLSQLMDSKIGKLASEISQEIDPTALDVSNPMELLDFKKMADGTSPLGSIITKVGSKIQDKLSTGEITQGELLAEAMTMLRAFDKDNALGSILAGKMPAAGGDLNALGDLAEFASSFTRSSQASSSQRASQSAMREKLRLKQQLKRR